MPDTAENRGTPETASPLIPQPHGGALRPFPPGVSGNPGGRPKRKPLTDAMEKLGDMAPAELEKHEPTTSWEANAKAMHLRGAKGSVMAVQEIGNRVEGKPTETVKHEGSVGLFAETAERLQAAREQIGDCE